MKDQISPLPNEPREAFLLRVAAFYIRNEYAGGTIFYDEAECDGLCVADECEAAAQDMVNIRSTHHLERLERAIENLAPDEDAKTLIKKLDLAVAPSSVFWGEDEDGSFISWGGMKVDDDKPFCHIKLHYLK